MTNTTERQVRVLAGVARGEGYAEISHRLHLSADIAKRDLQRVAAELRVGACPNRMPATVDAAYRAGLLADLPPEQRLFGPLPPRRQVVLELIARGLSNEAIAAEIGVSDNTIRTHLRLLFQDLGARNRHHAVALAHQLGHLTARPAALSA